MNFIKRIGTEKHSYLVSVIVQYVLTEYDFDKETIFKVQLRRGLFFSLADHKAESKPSSVLKNKMAIFEPQQLQIPVTMFYDVATKIYQEKKAELRVILIRKEIKKKVGNIEFDISEYLNKGQMYREEKRNLDKCPQKSTILQYQMYFKETENSNSSSKQEQKSIENSLTSKEPKQKIKWQSQDFKQINQEKSQQRNEKIANLFKQRQKQSLSQYNQPVKKQDLINFEQEGDEMCLNQQKKIFQLEEKLSRKENEIAQLKKREIELIQKSTFLESQNKKWMQKEKEQSNKDQIKQQTRENIQNRRLLQIQQQKYRKLQIKFNQLTKEFNNVSKLLKQKELDLNDKEESLDKLAKNNDANNFQKSQFLKRIEELEQELFISKKCRAEAMQAALQNGNFEYVQFLEQYIF